MDEQSPTSLVVLAQKGDEQAFNDLVKLYEKKVKGLLRFWTNNEADVDDLSQEVWIRVFINLAKFKGDCLFFTWVYVITRNAVVSFWKHQSKMVMVSIEEEEENETPSHTPESLIDHNTPETALQSKEALALIDDLVEMVPEQVRETFRLHHTEGLSYKAIAKRLKCPIGTIRSRLSRLRTEMTKLVEEKQCS